MTYYDSVRYSKQNLEDMAGALIAYANNKPWELLIQDSDGSVWREFPNDSLLDLIKQGRVVRARV